MPFLHKCYQLAATSRAEQNPSICLQFYRNSPLLPFQRQWGEMTLSNLLIFLPPYLTETKGIEYSQPGEPWTKLLRVERDRNKRLECKDTKKSLSSPVIFFRFFVSEEQVLGQSMKSTLGKESASTSLSLWKTELSRGNPHLRESDPSNHLRIHHIPPQDKFCLFQQELWG